MKYKQKLTVNEFLYVVKGECIKGCSRCKFKVPDIDVATSEKLCVFRNFRIVTDESLRFIASKAQEFHR